MADEIKVPLPVFDDFGEVRIPEPPRKLNPIERAFPQVREGDPPGSPFTDPRWLTPQQAARRKDILIQLENCECGPFGRKHLIVDGNYYHYNEFVNWQGRTLYDMAIRGAGAVEIAMKIHRDAEWVENEARRLNLELK